MDIGDHIAELREQLESLQRDAQEVSTAIREPTSGLSSGIPIDALLLNQIRDVCERVVAFRQRLKTFGAENSLIPAEINLDSARFADLNELLQQFELSSLARRQSITSKLEIVENLIVRKESLRPIFQVVFDEAKRLHELLVEPRSLSLPQELLDFGSEKHRLAKLLRFLEIQQDTEEVSPDELDVVDSEVEAAFGRRFRVLAHEFLRLPAGCSPAPAKTDEGAGLLDRESGPPAAPSTVEPNEVSVAANRIQSDAPERPPESDAVAAPPMFTALTHAIEVAPLEEVAISEITDDVDQYAEQLVAAAVAEAHFELPPPPEPAILHEDGPPEVFEPVFGAASEALAENAERILKEIESGGIQALDHRKVEAFSLQLLDAQRPGLAWVVWSGLRPAELPFGEALPTRVLRAAAIVRLMYKPDGKTSELLSSDCSALLSDWRLGGEVPPHYYFWLLAVAAKPALYAHDPASRDILWRIANSGAPSKAIRSLAKLFAEFASNESPLEPAQIRSTIHVGTRDTVLSDLKQKAAALLGRSGKSDRMSGSAMKVWRFLTQSDGVVRRLLQPVQESMKADSAVAAIREVRSTAAIKHEIELAEARAGTGTIRRGSPDYEDLIRDIEGAREVATRWVSLTVEPSSAAQNPVARFRADFDTTRKDVDVQLAVMIPTVQHPNQIAIRSACENCIETLESIAKVLRGEVEDWAPQDATARYMEADLHLIPGQDPGAWKRDCTFDDAFPILQFLKSKCRWRDCAKQLVARDRFESLGTAIQRLRGLSPTAASFLEIFRTETLFFRWSTLAWRYLKTEQALDNATTNALVGIDDAQNYRAQLDEIKAAIPEEFLAVGCHPAPNKPVQNPASHVFFASANNTIGEIDSILNRNREHFISEAGKTVVLPNTASPRVRAAFDRLLALGHLIRL